MWWHSTWEKDHYRCHLLPLSPLLYCNFDYSPNVHWLFTTCHFSEHVPVVDSDTVHEIAWTYPVVGYPEQVSEESQPAVVVCRSRDRVEERLEVTLSGVAPSSAGPKRSIKARAKTPADESPKLPDGVVVGESKLCFIYLIIVDSCAK